MHEYDCRGLHLSAASSLRLGLGPPRHINGPTAFDPKLPGCWRVAPEPWDHARLPDPLDPAAHGRTGPIWATTPTLAHAAELGFTIGPVEAYVYDQHGRYLEPWYRRLRDARAGMLAEAGTDPDAAAVLATIKLTYARGLGMTNAPLIRGSPEYRPDHWFHVVAEARAKVTRKMHQVAETTGATR